MKKFSLYIVWYYFISTILYCHPSFSLMESDRGEEEAATVGYCKEFWSYKCSAALMPVCVRFEVKRNCTFSPNGYDDDDHYV